MTTTETLDLLAYELHEARRALELLLARLRAGADRDELIPLVERAIGRL